MLIHVRQGARAGLCALVLACAACSQVADRPTPVEVDGKVDPSQQIQTGAVQIRGSGQATAKGLTLDQQVSAALTDLAARTGVAVDGIRVHRASSVHWGSSALGCPKAGMRYTQAIVPGVLLILEADGSFYRYHGRTGSKLFLCPAKRAQEPAYGPGQELM